MYSEYEVINGVLHYRSDPHGEFVPLTAVQITNEYRFAQNEIGILKAQIDKLQGELFTAQHELTAYRAMAYDNILAERASRTI